MTSYFVSSFIIGATCKTAVMTRYGRYRIGWIVCQNRILRLSLKHQITLFIALIPGTIAKSPVETSHRSLRFENLEPHWNYLHCESNGRGKHEKKGNFACNDKKHPCLNWVFLLISNKCSVRWHKCCAFKMSVENRLEWAKCFSNDFIAFQIGIFKWIKENSVKIIQLNKHNTPQLSNSINVCFLSIKSKKNKPKMTKLKVTSEKVALLWTNTEYFFNYFHGCNE